MRARTAILLILGILLLLSGTVFTLQGLGILGPTNGFMYNTQTWVNNGLFAVVVGVILIGLALFLSRTGATTSSSVKPASS